MDGKLQITQDVNRFACSHCGQEHIVKRSGGIVSLSPVVDAINRVEAGVDRTAAELAIARIEREMVGLQINRSNLLQAHPRKALPRKTKYSFVFAILFFVGLCITLFGFLLQGQGASIQPVILIIGALMALAGLWFFFSAPTTTEEWDKTIGVQIKSLDEQISAKQEELKHYQDIVTL